MTPQEIQSLSCYKEIAQVSPDHQVSLVQHQYSNKFFIRKILHHYHIDVYRHLIDHPIPGTPRIFEAVEDNGRLIIIEEYLSGTPLNERLASQVTFTENEVINIITQLCQIVDQLHHAEPPIIHRDIKPENILLTGDGSVKLLDMNAARLFNDQKSEDTTLLGTAGYAAPEQYGFAQSDVRTDIYAIGVLMNVLLTGKFPKDKTADGQLRPIIMKCTQLEPGLRFASVAELIKALENPGSAGIITAGENSQPSWRRFLPPGYRTGRPWSMIVGTMVYFILIYLGVTLKINTPLTDDALRLYRIFTTIMLIVMALFTGNYLNIQEKLPLSRSPKTPVRIIGILLINFLIFAITIILLALSLE